MTETDLTHDHDCDACPIVSRRAFMRDSALAMLALSSIPAIARALDTHGIGTLAGVALADVSPLAVRGPNRVYALPGTDGAQIDRDAELIVVRWEGAVYVFDLSCPHQHTALRWDDKAQHFKCPKHHSEYQPTGTFIKGRATRGMDRYPVKRENGQLVVDTTQKIRQDENAAAWDAAKLFVAEK